MTGTLILVASAAWAATGGVHIEAKVAGGQILLDGFPTGESVPTTLEDVPAGDHRVTVHVGCQTGEARVLVRADQVAAVSVPLAHRDGQGTVRLTGLPEGATVRVDGQEVDAAAGSVKAACGLRVFAVSAPGYAASRDEVLVTVEEWTTLPVALQAGAMEDGAVAAAGGGGGGGGAVDLFDDALEEDGFAFDPPPAAAGDDDAFRAPGPAAAPAAGGGGDDFLLDDGRNDGEDGWVPPMVAAALAGEDLSRQAPGPAPAREPRAETPPAPAKEARAEEAPTPAREPRPLRAEPLGSPRVGWPAWTTLGVTGAAAIGGTVVALNRRAAAAEAEDLWSAAVALRFTPTVITQRYEAWQGAEDEATKGWWIAGGTWLALAGAGTWVTVRALQGGGQQVALTLAY